MSQTGFNCAVKEKRTLKDWCSAERKLWPAAEERKIKERGKKRRENTLGAKIVFSSTLTVLGIITQ